MENLKNNILSKYREINKTSKDKIFHYYKAVCYFIILLTVIVCAWTADDAYHGYTQAQNLIDGYGFTPTPGIRVNVSTCPLDTLLVALLYSLFRNVYISGMILNFVCMIVTIYFLIDKFCTTVLQVGITTIVICTSKAFISYSTSGLENPLLFMLCIIYLYVFLHINYFNKKQLFFIALLEGLIAFTRMDAALVFSVSSATAFLVMRKDEFINSTIKNKILHVYKSILIAVLGLIPFIFWEIFSLFYYGSFTPNTMLAKLNTGFPQQDYLIRGIWYFISSLSFDVCVVMIPITVSIIFILLSFYYHKFSKFTCVAIGILLYLIYILCIGGDFMMGRHFTMIFLISYCLFLDYLNRVPNLKILRIIATLAILCMLFCNRFVCEEIEVIYAKAPFVYTDERSIYYPHTGLILVTADYVLDHDVSIIESCPHKGIEWYYGHIDAYEYRLYDPLLSRLPAIRTENWAVGHMEREIPEGYQETLETGINCIEDRNLSEYYDKLRFVLSGDLCDIERIRELFRFNSGKYDYLLEQYIQDKNL